MSGRPQWRSLADLEGDPRVQGFVRGEFPEGADLPPDATTRREFVTLLGASLSLAGLSACRRPEEHIVPFAEAPEQMMPGVPRRYATTLPFGTSAYGLVVESHEGRPTKIEGNELHPATLGSSSARIQAEMLALYDPDRSTTVQRQGARAQWADFVAAWKTLAAAHQADQGAGLAVISEPFSSPTLARLRAAFLAAYPRARWIAWQAAGEQNVHAGVAQAAGRPLLGVHDLAAARVVLSLDADFLLGDAEMVRHTRGFAAGRRVTQPGDAMSRLYAVEALHTVTGANADHRVRLQARLVPAFLAALLAELGRQGLALAAPAAEPPPGVDAKLLRALASDLLAHRGAGLVLAGRRQPPAVHAAVYALNAALGNLGRTVGYHEPSDALLAAHGELPEVVGALDAGQVKTLVLMGVNPAYDAPADLGFGAAVKKAAEVLHLGLQRDETAALSSWHVPAAHFLEAWGDARAACGTLSVVQPLVLPLHGGKSAVELAGLLATGEARPGYDLVRETWQGVLGNAAQQVPGQDFETRWNRVLHDGLLADSALPPVAAPAAAGALAALGETARELAGRPGLELVFEPCARVHDGRHANCAWLQELPDAMTKITWDNPLLVSPATAASLGVADDDLARVELGGRAIELPVFRVPGMADGTLAVTLGYGRRAAGRVGSGVGVDTYALRASTALDLAFGASLRALGAKSPLSHTQEHGSMEGRPIVRTGTLDEFRRQPGFARERAETPELFSLWEERKYDQGPQWGMAIDLNACTGCNACAVACQSENNVPVVGKEQVRRGREMAWLRIDRYFEGRPDEAGAVFQPVPCMHCENAPCEQVCPVAATVHDHEGLNAMVYNRCIGTRYCSNNCPYKVRRFNFFNYTKDTPETLKMAMNPDVTVRSRGVMEKCTYCVQRLSRAKLDARLAGRPLKDGDVQTACQQACPAQAIVFGDLTDRQSRVAQVKAQPRGYALLEELNTRPRTTYLARLRNPHPDLASGPQAEHGGSHG